MAFGGENWAKPRTVGKSSFPRRSSEWWLGLPGSRIYRSGGEDFAAERSPLGLESNRRARLADRRRQWRPRARQKGARHAPRPTTRRGNRLSRRTPAVRSDKNHSRSCWLPLAAELLGLPWKVGALVAGASDRRRSLLELHEAEARSSPEQHGNRTRSDTRIASSVAREPPRAARGMLDIVVGVIIFFGAELVLSRILFKLRLRDKPYGARQRAA